MLDPNLSSRSIISCTDYDHMTHYKLSNGCIYVENSRNKDYFCYYSDGISTGPSNYNGYAQGWKKEGVWNYRFAIRDVIFSKEGWSKHTGHILCDFCKSFCNQGCKKFNER